jgi:hypothetical protein
MRRPLALTAGVCLVLGILSGVGVSVASAATPAWWHIEAMPSPTYLPPGGAGRIDIEVNDIGDVNVSGSAQPIVIAGKLPPGMTATGISASSGFFNSRFSEGATCSLKELSCQFPGAYTPFEGLEVSITVSVAADAGPSEPVEASASGGEAVGTGTTVPASSIRHSVTVGSQAVPFGVEHYELSPENESGSVDAQAGSHPFQLTASFALNQKIVSEEKGEGIRHHPEPAALPKDFTFELPAGLIGNVTQTPQCTSAEFSATVEVYNLCAANTAIGVAQLIFSSPSLQEGEGGYLAKERPLTVPVPLFNLTPLPGEPARFGFEYESRPVYLEASVRTGGDYGVTVTVKNITQQVGLIGSEVTFWGVPGDERHDHSRGYPCIDGGEYPSGGLACLPPQQRSLTPLLTLPTRCGSPLTEPLQSTVLADSWKEPSNRLSSTITLANSAGSPLALEGCDRLPFDPSVSTESDSHSANSPMGLTVGVHVPQEADETPAGVSESDLRDTTVTLPQGVTLNPSAANGLLGCSEAQIALQSPGAGACPEAAKVGTVSIKTPLLPNELAGSVYVASPQNLTSGLNENPFRSLVALYIVAEDPVSKVVVKLAGKVTPNETTGQLTTSFENTPQLPFEDLKLKFFGGARAPLSTPSSCGTYTSEASFTPYSGTAAVQSSSKLEISSGAEGTGCSASRPFAPSFTAGTTATRGGAYSPFTLTFSRRDQDQNLGAITVQTPTGLLGDLASVPLCMEAQANAGTCSAASQIGDTTTEAGVGSDPVTLPQPGEAPDPVYLTGPYGGQPFGLSFVVPAVAGPFNLGTVVVRASIAVNPVTSALTITSNPLPTMLRGVPLDIKTVNVTVNRPGFMFNPTSCGAQSIGGTITSRQGASSPVSSPFEATNCATLPFKPTLSVSTAGRASKAGGASLDVRISSKGGPQAAGEEANIRSVKVDLPIKLPSRLTTLQKACVAAVFAANPASCPKESDVGSASATTPVLTHPLAGPAYLVSHGGAAFPDLEIVLQGEGIVLILDGKTQIKKGITSSTFRTVPDAPVSSFELKLPTGKFSILAANLPASADYSFCGQTLSMPTAITGQNGAVYKPATKVAVTGCPKAKKAAKKKAKPKKKAKSSGSSK